MASSKVKNEKKCRDRGRIKIRIYKRKEKEKVRWA
jgi:hypothetical protein